MKYLVIAILFLLSFTSAKAQYLGGNGDGYAMGETRNVALGLNDDIQFQGIKIFPNPVEISRSVNIQLQLVNTVYKALEIYNIYGQQIYYQAINGEKNISINIASKHFSKGVYMLKMVAVNEEIIQRKLVVN